ncbi:hypothetical protein DL98DRAFT_113000 [Cadophora sp. DSE1049]|nr:hypothetical protein DL98DRAFT_113000 [Cadophora sp. DSE1049]
MLCFGSYYKTAVEYSSFSVYVTYCNTASMFARLQRVSSTRLLGLQSVRTTTPTYHTLFPRNTSHFSTSTCRKERKRAKDIEKKVREATASKKEEGSEGIWSRIGRESIIEMAQLGIILGAVTIFTYAGEYWRWVMVIHYGRGLERFADHKSNVIEKERDIAASVEESWMTD